MNTLWPLFGISIPDAGAIALTLCTVVIFKMMRERYALVTIVPTLWIVACTLDRRPQKVFSAIRGWASWRLPTATPPRSRGQGAGPAKTADQMRQIVLNDRIDAVLALVFVGVVVAIIAFGVKALPQGLRADRWTAVEADPRAIPGGGGVKPMGTETLRERWATLTRCVCDGARLMVGQGNYDTTSPISADPSRPAADDATEFFRERQNARFGVGGRGGFRCC